MKKLIGIYLIAGGILGLVAGISGLLSGISLLSGVVSLVLCGTSIISGASVYKQDKFFDWLAYLVLIFQVPALSLNNFIYQVYILVNSTVYITSNLAIGFDFNTGTRFSVVMGEWNPGNTSCWCECDKLNDFISTLSCEQNLTWRAFSNA